MFFPNAEELIRLLQYRKQDTEPVSRYQLAFPLSKPLNPSGKYLMLWNISEITRILVMCKTSLNVWGTNR